MSNKRHNKTIQLRLELVLDLGLLRLRLGLVLSSELDLGLN